MLYLQDLDWDWLDELDIAYVSERNNWDWSSGVFIGFIGLLLLYLLKRKR